MRPLVWFRNDLRASDNPALHEAARRADRGVVAVYTICPTQWQRHDMAPVKVDFILRNLTALSKTLAEKNIALRIVQTPTFDEVPHALAMLADDLECDALFYNREYEVNERSRDEAVTDAFEDNGRRAEARTDQCLFEPGELRTGEGNYYTVFSPFKRRWYRAFDADRGRGRPLSVPAKQPAMVGAPDTIPKTVDGFDSRTARPDLWIAGEPTAWGKLGAFIGDRLHEYAERRDIPSVIGTSVLSPYLSSGVLSPRQCVHAALEANDGRLDTGSGGAVTWIGELIWREFYKHVLAGFPRVSMHRAFRRQTEQIRWKDDDEHFVAWCEGRTGFPIVDAAMRQLVQTGWMHNRLRMIVAMFLSKNLFLDWRRGERFFMQHLVDGDLAPNNGGWQWSASTGTDAAPYFRIFNPYSQSKKFDRDGTFIRRYLPELAELDGKDIHEPPSVESLDYPEPIVDYATTRQHAIDAFKAI